MNSNFFDTNSYFIDEKVNFFKFENAYKVFDNNGVEIGSVIEKVDFGQKILRLLLNKSMLPFNLDIKDTNNNLLSSLKRGWTFWVSTITISDSNGIEIGIIKQKFKLFKPTFEIYTMEKSLVAIITGDWKAWEFVINDAQGKQIGTISKKWAGAMKEIFTTADKYNVNIDPSYTSNTSKIAIVSSAITIDMVLKENK